MYKIEIKNNLRSGRFELWQHFLNEPRDIIYPVLYSNFIDSSNIEKFMIEKAMNEFNIGYHHINFTKEEIDRY